MPRYYVTVIEKVLSTYTVEAPDRSAAAEQAMQRNEAEPPYDRHFPGKCVVDREATQVDEEA